VHQLEQQLFGQASPSLAALQQAFLQALVRAHPKMRYPRIGIFQA